MSLKWNRPAGSLSATLILAHGAGAPMELGADALVCLGYPFYAAGKPEKPRVAHLAGLRTPTLIVQGERDALGNREAVAGYALAPTIRLHWLAAADHDLKPLKASGLTHEQHLAATAREVAGFLRGLQGH